MTPKRKLAVANALMVVGIVPFGLGISWIVSIIAYANQHKGQMGASDAFLMMGVLFVTYATALLVSGPSALWSAVVARRNPGLPARASAVIRSCVYLVLVSPLLCYLGITFSLF
jgi:hypothetical protein